MKKVTMRNLAGVACAALLLALPAVAANSSVTKSTKTAERSSEAHNVWPPETLSGKITMVDPSQNLVVVTTADGIPFDIVITPRTRIQSGSQSVSLNNLAKYDNDSVSMRFVPERRGDVAQSIHING